MANVNAPTSQFNAFTTAPVHESFASDIANATQRILATDKVFGTAPLHALTRFKQNRPLDHDEIRQQLHHGFASSTENLQPGVHPVWAFFDEAATEEASRTEKISEEERRAVLEPLRTVKTWTDLKTAYTTCKPDGYKWTLPSWIRLKVFHGQHRIHLAVQAIAKEFGLSPSVLDERLWGHKKWSWAVIIVDESLFTPREVELWCLLSHQTSTYKVNDPISVVRSLINYQMPFSSLPDWVLDSLGMDSNQRRRSWLRTAHKTFSSELSELSRTPYFSWFFPRWDYIMETLAPSNETVSRKLIQELVAEARNRAAGYDMSTEQLTLSHCFKSIGDIAGTIPSFDILRKFIRRPGKTREGQEKKTLQDLYETHFLAAPCEEKSQFTGEPGCGLGKARIWTPHGIWGTLPASFNSRIDRLKQLLRVLLYIKNGQTVERIKYDFYRGLANELGWPEGADELHEEFKVLWKSAAMEGSPVSSCRPGTGFEKRVVAEINIPESLLGAFYSLESSKRFLEQSDIGQHILTRLTTGLWPDAPSTLIDIPTPSSQPIYSRPRRLRTLPAVSRSEPTPGEGEEAAPSSGLHGTGKRHRDSSDSEVYQPAVKRKKKIPGGVFKGIQLRIVEDSIALEEFTDLVKDYDQDDLSIAMARIALEEREKARTKLQERDRLAAQEPTRLQEQEKQRPQEPDKAHQVDTSSRRSSGDLPQRAEFQSLIQSVRGNDNAMEALFGDEVICSWFRNRMVQRN